MTISWDLMGIWWDNMYIITIYFNMGISWNGGTPFHHPFFWLGFSMK
jgi:hypothetical protein